MITSMASIVRTRGVKMSDIVSISPNRIKERRTKYRLTQADLAKHLDVSQQTIARWESGKSEVPMTAYQKMVVLFGCSITDLIKVPDDDEVSKAVKRLNEAREEFYDSPDHNIPWGTLSVEFLGEVSDLHMPIDRYTYNNVWSELVDMVSDTERTSWCTTLDNRYIFINTELIKTVRFTDDNDEPMPNFYHEEIYKILDGESDDLVDQQLEEVDPEAAKEFADEEHRWRTTSYVKVCMRDSTEYQSYKEDSDFHEIDYEMHDMGKPFLCLPHQDTDLIIRKSEIAYVSLPLLKYKVWLTNNCNADDLFHV